MSNLAYFQRSMTTKCRGKCAFCGTATVPGVDFAALNGKWIAVCALHANATLIEQTNALVLRLSQQAEGLSEADTAALAARLPATLPAVQAGTATYTEAVAVVLTLLAIGTSVQALAPVAPRSNRYAGTCQTCQGRVAEGAGRIERNEAGKWVTFHLDGQCPTAPAPTVARVAEGRYALVDDDGTVKFYRVEHGKAGGKWEGCTFVSAQASDDLYPIRNAASRTAILDAIAADETEALARYGREVGKCGRCGRTLTSEWRQRGIGPVCAAKAW